MIEERNYKADLWLRYRELAEWIYNIEKEAVPFKKEREEIIVKIAKEYGIDFNPSGMTATFILDKVVFEVGQQALNKMSPVNASPLPLHSGSEPEGEK